MSNVAHAELTGAELHEPKGADTADLGTVYVADGAGSGSWANVGTSSFTGMIADFVAPVAPTGWLELDGSVVSTSTFSGLFAVMSMTSSGTRSNGSAIVTSIADTSDFKVGYFVFGTGIASGTTISTIDSASQITLSNNAASSGTASFFVSPWLMDTGTVQLPDVTTAGRYRRSRTDTTKVGDLQDSQNKAHTHTSSGTTGTGSAHTHTYSGTTGTENQSHSHAGVITSGNSYNSPGGATTVVQGLNGGSTGAESQNHGHAYSGTTAAESSHTHSFSAVSDSNGGTEARPSTLIVLTCVKT